MTNKELPTVGLLELAKQQVLVLDGAMGSAIQNLGLDEEVFGGRLGCNEYLALTAPEAIKEIHNSYLEAGSHIIETDTFGASAETLAEYDLADQTEKINCAAASIARQAADSYNSVEHPRFVAGSIGPGTKLPTLGQITFERLYTAYSRQITGLLDGGVDLLLIETCQDLLQTKAALIAARELMGQRVNIPLYVSVTIEQTGTLLTGSDIDTVIAVLAPFDIDVLGLNCGTGPAPMRPHLEVLARRWPGQLGMFANAGIPVPSATGARYPESPEEMGATVERIIEDVPLNYLGGCCGTTPAHIARLAKLVEGVKPRGRQVDRPRLLASTFNAVSMQQEPAPLIMGERANATGSKAFRDALLARDFDSAFEILNKQADQGNHCADLSVAYVGLNELDDMKLLVAQASKECLLPLVIDSNNAEVTEAALKLYAGRAVINSINLEDGGERAEVICPMAKRFGSALVCLTIDEEGMAMTTERKVSVAHRLVDLCTSKYGLDPGDLFIDPLTFTICSGDPSLKTAAIETINALKVIKAELPGVSTLLGVSNISFGLDLPSRKVLNSVFLHACLEAGLDAAILNPRHITPLSSLVAASRGLALDLVHNKPSNGNDPLEAYLDHFAGHTEAKKAKDTKSLPPDEALYEGIISGNVKLVDRKVPILLKDMEAEDILNNIIVSAMKHVGELFGSGEMQLPFVLKSAEATKRAVGHLEPHFKQTAQRQAPKKLLIATVKGDVHDIGKNLVTIIVGNNGYDVIDLGTKVPVETIVSETLRLQPDVIGMSGLLVSSAIIMGDNLRAMSEAGIEIPVLVGGAALTPGFVADTLKPAYSSGKVFYCADAFAGLLAMQQVEAGKLPAEPLLAEGQALPQDSLPPGPMEIEQIAMPTPPFLGDRLIETVNLDSVMSLVNELALFRGRWGYRRGKLSAEEFKHIVETEIRPKHNELTRLVKAEKIFKPQIVYGWFKAHSEGNKLFVENGGVEHVFSFPRRRTEPKISIPDFVRKDQDIVGFFLVTLGSGTSKRVEKILADSEYLDYFLLHGLAVEATDALAEYAHELMRHEIGIGEETRLGWQGLVTQQYQSSRYGFGYPACPDLSANETVFKLLKPERIGVELSESWQMVPEMSTSAIVLHHPQAKYFSP